MLDCQRKYPHGSSSEVVNEQCSIQYHLNLKTALILIVSTLELKLILFFFYYYQRASLTA